MTRLATSVSARDHIRGSSDAGVTLVQYGDYECPYTNEAYHVVRRLLAEMSGIVRFVFRNFPLTQIHPHALPAALAAESANRQGAFWQMHDMLFEHHDELEPEHLVVYAQVLGLDMERFIVDMTSDIVSEQVREDFMSGIRSGVNGTPTFFFNSRRYDGSYDFETLSDAIETAAGRKQHDPSSNQTDSPESRHSRAGI